MFLLPTNTLYLRKFKSFPNCTFSICSNNLTSSNNFKAFSKYSRWEKPLHFTWAFHSCWQKGKYVVSFFKDDNFSSTSFLIPLIIFSLSRRFNSIAEEVLYPIRGPGLRIYSQPHGLCKLIGSNCWFVIVIPILSIYIHNWSPLPLLYETDFNFYISLV